MLTASSIYLAKLFMRIDDELDVSLAGSSLIQRTERNVIGCNSVIITIVTGITICIVTRDNNGGNKGFS